MAVRPYGTWPSALSAEVVARGAGRWFSGVYADDDGRLRWLEYRADEGGRGVVVEDGRDVTPAGVNVRTRVHEYGGGAWWVHGDTVFYSDFGDSRLYRVDAAGAESTALTPEPASPHALRYADGVVSPDGSTIVCVRERHEDGAVFNELVSLPADGSAEPEVVFRGADFVSTPRFDPVRGRLCWLAWNHPRMPWDGTDLYVDGEVVAGGEDESLFQPEWSPDGTLHFCSDANGRWNLHRLGGGPLTSLEDGEIGAPAWAFAMRRYGFLADERIACAVTRDAADSIELLDPETGALERLELAWTEVDPSTFGASGSRIVFSAASPTMPRTLVAVDVACGREELVRRSFDAELDGASISVPRAIEFPTGDGGTAHAFYYPPTSAGFEGPEDERPPLRVVCHGGPTAHSPPSFALTFQFFTQRGIGVVDVNYRGSSGYGREYRRLLNGRWGEIDWRDCVAAARHLAEQGETDPGRTWVSGGSAGGYAVICALVYEPRAFAAGVSYFGVADVEALVLDTHKFESRYLDSMIGPYPEQAGVYRERSPVHFADRLERPLLLLQGLDDEVVPPSQAEAMVEVLERKGIPYAYLPFEGEGHGFRRSENIQRSLEAELGFVGRVFGFEPADDLELLQVENL